MRNFKLLAIVTIVSAMPIWGCSAKKDTKAIDPITLGAPQQQEVPDIVVNIPPTQQAPVPQAPGSDEGKNPQTQQPPAQCVPQTMSTSKGVFPIPQGAVLGSRPGYIVVGKDNCGGDVAVPGTQAQNGNVPMATCSDGSAVLANACPVGTTIVNGPVMVPVTPIVVVVVDPVQDCYKETPEICEVENYVAERVNRLRARNNLPPLIANFQIAFAAREWAAMQSREPQAADLAQAVLIQQSEFGVDNVVFTNLVAQNNFALRLASSEPAVLAEMIVQVILNDTTSRAIILTPTLRAFGTGVVVRRDRAFVTQFFAN